MRGLVIGKFMPVHAGHLALIDYALTLCDELIVSMSYTSTDPINASIREHWLKEIFGSERRVLINSIEDNFDDPSLSFKERTKIWAEVISENYPPIDVLISSEEYGEPLGKHLGAKHFLFDLEREKVPISASQIRTNPFKNWELIPQIVRPYFLKKVCFYGAESTGKTEMARRIADYYHTEFVPEVAREMIDSNNFSVEDIIAIGEAQTSRILEKEKIANKILICDTDIITTQIYSGQYLNVVPSVLKELEKKIKYDHYFLFDIDVPWVEDGLRDLGSIRSEMHEKFKHALANRGISYSLVRGSWDERFEIVRDQIDSMLRSSQ